MKIIPQYAFVGSVLAFGVSSLCAGTVFQESFANGRETQNPPASLAWFATVPNSVEMAAGGLRVFGAEESERAVIANFPEVTLQPGDRLVLRFQVTPLGEIGSRNGALRVGLYNVENPPFAEGENPQAMATGYLFAFNNITGTDGDAATGYMAMQIYERLDGGDGILRADPPLTANQNHVGLGAHRGGAGSFESGETYDVELSIKRESETSLNLECHIAGGLFTDQNDFTLPVTGTQDRIFSAFNTLAFVARAAPGDGNGGFPEIRLSNVRLDIVSQ